MADKPQPGEGVEESLLNRIRELRTENERLRAKEVELREELVRLRGEIWDLTHPSA